MPDNCVLEFNGGSISGAYTVTGNGTGIRADLVKIFGTDVTLSGSWNVAEAYPEWFGAKGDGVSDDTDAVQKAIDSFLNVILTRNYNISDSIIITKHGLNIQGGSIVKVNTESSYSENAIFVIKAIHVLIKDMTISGSVSNSVKGVVFDENSSEGTYKNLMMTNLDYCFYDNHYTYELTFTQIHCRNCNNAFWLFNNNEKTTIVLKNCWVENCGNAYMFKNTHYSSLIACGADWCNYVKDDNPYGVSFGSKNTGAGIYNLDSCHNISIYNCGSENSYGNGVVRCSSCVVTINGLTYANIKSEYAPNYVSYPSWGVGAIVTTTEFSCISVNGVYDGGFENTFVKQNNPSKDQGIIACNYSQSDYGNKPFHHIICEGLIGGGSLKRICGYGYSENNDVVFDLDKFNLNGIINVVSYLNLVGARQYATKSLNSSPASNQLIIPITSQGVMNQVGVIEVVGCDNSSNQDVPLGFKFTVQFGSLTTLKNVSLIDKSNNDISVNTNGMNIVVTLPTIYTNIIVQVNVLRTTLVEVDNIHLGS